MQVDEVASGTSTATKMCQKVEDFDWITYLDESKLEAVPDPAFQHVEASLDSGVRVGMIVERPRAKDSQKFWLAIVDSVFGPLLKLSWLGDADMKEIWHDLERERLYPVGWCQMNKLPLEPPERIIQMCPKWKELSLEYLEDPTYDTISMHFIDGDGVTPVERIKVGQQVSLHDDTDPGTTSLAEILFNKGGLLKLRRQAAEDKTMKEELLFYTSPRISEPPEDVKNAPPRELLAKAKNPPAHKFAVGDSLDVVLDGKALKSTVDKLLPNNYFSVHFTTDDKSDSSAVFSKESSTIAPSGFLLCDKAAGDKSCNSKSAWSKFTKRPTSEELGFEQKQKLMVLFKEEFHPASILETRGHFIKVSFDTAVADADIDLWFSVHDPVIFPLSWCQSNGVSFYLPSHLMESSTKEDQQEQQSPVAGDDAKVEDEAKNKDDDVSGSWCPPIYFNYKCYSASFLSRARLASLPKSVGPGSVKLVIREVLNLIIGSSFKSGSVLKRLENKTGIAPVNYVVEELKGKSRVLNLKAMIDIPTKADQVEKYLREMCQKLSACPHLVSTSLYDETCPANCNTRKKAEFKDDDNSNLNGAVQKAFKNPVGRRRKRRHPDALLVENSRSNQATPSSSDESEASSSRPSSPVSRKQKQRKEWENILPKSEIRTRGAKLPNFRLHMKIRPSRKEQRDLENSKLRGVYATTDALLNKSGAKKGRRELPPAFSMDDFPKPPPPIRRIRLSENPEKWTPRDTARFLAQTTDCSHLARFMIDDEIDGQAFMLLNFPTAKEYWKLKTTTAISLCRHIESVRLAHLIQYRNYPF